MKEPKLSLVFCCYNVSQYLDDIYKWLCEQPYQNIEVIFVEDCATDDTKEKLYSLVHDPRMKIVENPKNLGLAESRNVGLQHATGDYIGFPDPDDQFEINWLVEISNIIKNNNVDVIITGMREDYENNDKLEFSKDIVSRYSNLVNSEKVFSVLVDLEENFLLGYMNNKFYSRDFLLENKFSCKSLALKEDFEFNVGVFSKINSFYILNKPSYFYKKRINGNSLTSKFVPEYFDIHFNSVVIFKKLLESKGELSVSAKQLLVNRFFRYFLSAIERNTNKKSGLTFEQQCNWIKSIIKSDENITWFIENSEFLGFKLKFLPVLIQFKAYRTLVLFGYFVKYMKSYLPILFAKLK